MAFKISTLEIRQKLGDILNRVFLKQDEFIVERKGKPLAALISIMKLEQMQYAAQLHLLEILKKRPSVSISQEEADRIADEAKHESRLKRKK